MIRLYWAIKKLKRRMRRGDLATRQTCAQPPSLSYVFSSFRSSRSLHPSLFPHESFLFPSLSSFFPRGSTTRERVHHSPLLTIRCSFLPPTPAPYPAITAPDPTHRRWSSSATYCCSCQQQLFQFPQRELRSIASGVNHF